MTRRSLAFCLGITLATSALAAEESGPTGYVFAGAGTTVMYVANDGTTYGPLGDVSPTLGVGLFVGGPVSVELNAYMAFGPAGYLATGLGPAVSCALGPNVFTAARLFVPIDPDLNLVFIPGVGLTHTFANHLAPFVEFDLATAIGRGHPDLALAPSAGLTIVL